MNENTFNNAIKLLLYITIILATIGIDNSYILLKYHNYETINQFIILFIIYIILITIGVYMLYLINNQSVNSEILDN